MVALKVQSKDVESGIKSQTNSIPVHSRVILQNGESFMDGANLLKNDLSQLTAIWVKRTPEGVWQTLCKIKIKDRLRRLIWLRGGAWQKGFLHQRRRRGRDEEGF
jgi:hypothetical protein